MSTTGVSFKIGTDNTEAKQAIKEFRDEFKALRNELKTAVTDIKIKFLADAAGLHSEISTIKNQIKSQIGLVEVDVKVKADNASIAASAAHIKSQLRTALGTVDIALNVSANQTALNSDLLLIRNRVNAYFATGVAVRIVPTLTAADSAAAKVKLQGLVNNTYQAKVGINLAYLNSQIALARTMLSSLGSGVNINVDATASNLIHALNELKAEVIRLRTAMSSGGGGGLGGGAGGNVGVLAGLRGQLAGLLASYVGLTSVVAAFNKTISAQREFDILNAQLETATKSSENAKIAFAALQDFAKKTPYDLKQAVDGFTKLVNLGLTPSERALMSYGNTAASMGKDLMQFIEAVADASTSEFERLKEFGIKAKQEGDKVSFTFQGVTKTIGNNAKEIEEYLIKIGENEFAGAMAKRVDTLDGAIAGLKDNWNSLFLEISKSGIGDLVKESVKEASDEVEDFTDLLRSGAIQSALKGISSTFSIFSDGAISDISDIGTSFSDLGKHMIETWKSTISELNTIGNTWTTVKALAQKAGVNVAAGVDIISDPFNRRTTNQQKEDNRKGLLSAIDDEALNNWDGVSKGFDEAEKKRKAYQAKLEADRKKEQEDRLAQFKLKQDESTPKSDDKEAKKKADKEKRQAEQLSQAKYEYEKKLIDQQIKDNEQLYKDQQINFVDYTDTKSDLNQKLYSLETSYLSQLAAKSDQHERSLIAYKLKNVNIEAAARQNAMLQEFNEYMKNLEKRKQAILDIIDDNNIDINADDLEKSLWQVTKTFKKTKEQIDELKKALGEKIAVDFTLPNGTIVKLSHDLINDLQKQVDQQEIEIKTKIALDSQQKQIQKNVDKILSDKSYRDKYADIQANMNPMQRPSLEEKKRLDTLETIPKLKAELQDLYNLQKQMQNEKFNIDALEEINKKIQDLNINIKELEASAPTFWQEFRTNIIDTGVTVAQSGLADYFMDIMEGTKTANQALKDLARTFISSIAQMATQALAKLAIFAALNAMTGGAAGAGVGFGGTILKAMGFQLHDGGKKENAKKREIKDIKSNEFVAILEDTEEVLTKNDPRHIDNFNMNDHIAKLMPRTTGTLEALMKPDSDFMQIANNVNVHQQTTPVSSGSPNVVTKVINVFTEEQAMEHLASSAGERVQLNTIQRNIGTIKQMLADD